MNVTGSSPRGQSRALPPLLLHMIIRALNCTFSENRGAAGVRSVSGTWERVTFFLLLPLPTMPPLSSCPLLLSSLLRGLAPSVFFPFVHLQHLPLSLGSPDSSWPGTAPVYSYCPNIIINSIYSQSQKCLVWLINYLVLLFIFDLDLQTCKCSNSPILKIPDTHIPNPMPNPIFLFFLHSHTSGKYCSDPFSQFPALP